MLNARKIAAIAGALTLLAVPASQAAAQDQPLGIRPTRFTAEVYLAQYSLDNTAADGGRSGVGGFGGRLMFNRSTASDALRTFFTRASGGVFATLTSGKGAADLSTQHYGVQGDVALFPAPVARGFLDPFVSLGVGAFRTSIDNPLGSGRIVNTDFAVTPAVGTRVPLFSGLSFRGDLRTPVIFGDNTSVNFVAEEFCCLGTRAPLPCPQPSPSSSWSRSPIWPRTSPSTGSRADS
jgi:hypothetical protein